MCSVIFKNNRKRDALNAFELGSIFGTKIIFTLTFTCLEYAFYSILHIKKMTKKSSNKKKKEGVFFIKDLFDDTKTILNRMRKQANISDQPKYYFKETASVSNRMCA